MAGGTGHSKPNHSGTMGEGRDRPQVAYIVDATCVRVRHRRWGERHPPKDLCYRNPGLYIQKGRWAGIGFNPMGLVSKPVGGPRTTCHTSS